MAGKSNVRPYLVRLAVIFIICLVFVITFNEITYLFQKDAYDRAPEAVRVTIPQGTSERVEAGEPEPAIPEGLVFVVGDVLEVVNEDNVAHQLGPLWVPAKTTASLAMDEPTTASYSCSFRPDRYMDIDVRQPTTWADRLTGISIAAPTLATLVFLYSLAAKPIPGEKPKSPESGQDHALPTVASDGQAASDTTQAKG
jgi:hypothetical protein